MIRFRRRAVPQATSVAGVAETEIAVGSLSGITPSQISRHIVIVLSENGDVHLSTSCCKNEAPELLVRALQLAITSAARPGPCEHGELSAAGHWETS